MCSGIGVHISFQIPVFVFFEYPEVGLLGCMVVLFLIFWGIQEGFSSAFSLIFSRTLLAALLVCLYHGVTSLFLFSTKISIVFNSTLRHGILYTFFQIKAVPLGKAMGLFTPSLAFLLGRILMPLHWSWAQGPTFPAVTTSPYEIGTRRWWQPLIFFLCPSGLGTIALSVSQGRNDSGQYSWLVAPGVELLPYKWGLGGERRPQSFRPYLPGIELLQHEIRNTSTWVLLG